MAEENEAFGPGLDRRDLHVRLRRPRRSFPEDEERPLQKEGMRLHRHRLPREPGDIRNRPRMPDLGGVAEGPEGPHRARIDHRPRRPHGPQKAHRGPRIGGRGLQINGQGRGVPEGDAHDQQLLVLGEALSRQVHRDEDEIPPGLPQLVRLRLQGEGAGRKMAENGEIAQAFAPQHRKLQAFMVTFSQHFRVLLEII